MGTNPFLKPRSFLDRIRSVFSGATPVEHVEELEQAMIEADIDLQTVGQMAEALKKGSINSFEAARKFLKDNFLGILKPEKRSGIIPPAVILLAGINGAGKTTTAAKLAALFKREGRKVLFIAADTFRAAAAEQLDTWAQRTGTEIIRGMDGADPASVVYDGLAAAKKSGSDIIIADTAGRLHTKGNLMQELEKVKKIIIREMPGANFVPLLVIDANTGKNAFNQAKEFNAALGLSGIILTKFDSSSKGGSIVRIKSELGLPVLYYTFGESIHDIEEFDPVKFVEKMFD